MESTDDHLVLIGTRLVKGKGKKGEGNVPLFPSPGREGNQPQGEEGEGKIQGDPLYSANSRGTFPFTSLDEGKYKKINNGTSEISFFFKFHCIKHIYCV